MGSNDTTSFKGRRTVVRVPHSSFHASSNSRFDKSKSACSGNAQTNGFRGTLRATLSNGTETARCIQAGSQRTCFDSSRSDGLKRVALLGAFQYSAVNLREGLV